MDYDQLPPSKHPLDHSPRGLPPHRSGSLFKTFMTAVEYQNMLERGLEHGQSSVSGYQKAIIKDLLGGGLKSLSSEGSTQHGSCAQEAQRVLAVFAMLMKSYEKRLLPKIRSGEALPKALRGDTAE